ncbi:MAG: hypothetical protein J6T26_07710 [Firmicutes bacterium]|nr:hypothetical protein [Bacillota bacterium]
MRENEREISRINGIARAKGLSYGQYAVRLAMDRQGAKPTEQPAEKKRKK